MIPFYILGMALIICGFMCFLVDEEKPKSPFTFFRLYGMLWTIVGASFFVVGILND